MSQEILLNGFLESQLAFADLFASRLPGVSLGFRYGALR